MSGSVINPSLPITLPAEYSTGHPPQLPIAIDYPAALALRQMALAVRVLMKRWR